jgi:hypothetical protein
VRFYKNLNQKVFFLSLPSFPSTSSALARFYCVFSINKEEKKEERARESEREDSEVE